MAAPSPKRQKLSTDPVSADGGTSSTAGPGPSTSVGSPSSRTGGRGSSPVPTSSAVPPPIEPTSGQPAPPPSSTTLDEQAGVIPNDPALSDLGRSFPNGAGVTKVNLVEELDVGGSGSRVDMDEVVVGVNGNGAGNGIAKADADEDEEEEEDEEVEELPEPEKEEQDQAHGDMYLDTVSLQPLPPTPLPLLTYLCLPQVARQNLEFDFERLCSKSLSNQNVYCCLVCGKYFQGRGKGSWAYRHAVGEGHRVWLGLGTEKVGFEC